MALLHTRIRIRQGESNKSFANEFNLYLVWQNSQAICKFLFIEYLPDEITTMKIYRSAFFMSTNRNIKFKWINRKAENIECANSNSISVCWRTLNYTSTWCLMQLVYFKNALRHRSSKRKKNPLNSAIFSELFYHHTAELQLYTIA